MIGITEETVERGAKALYAKGLRSEPWEITYEIYRILHRNDARIVLEAALSAPPARQEWQPIETAPKDGTRVLLWSPDAAIDNPYMGHWVDRADYPDGGAWWEKDDNSGFCADADPSHWMPLPESPAQALARVRLVDGEKT